MLPPLNNVCALFEPDPRRRPALRQQLSESRFFDQIHELAHGWLLGISAVGSTPSTRIVGNTVFCERNHPDLSDESELLWTSEHRPETLARFSGDFTFVHLLSDGSIVLVRSCAGKVPLYYSRARRIQVASRLDYMVAFSDAPVQLDPMGTALALSGYGICPDGRSPIAGVRCLAPGHHLRLDGQSTNSSAPLRYWTPRKDLQRPTTARVAEHSQRLRESLCHELRRELDPSGGNLLWLSGGVDSSALAALIVDDIQAPLSTQSFMAPDRATARYDESYLFALQERYRFEHSLRTVNTAEHCLHLARISPRVSYPTCYFPLSALTETTRNTAVRVAIGGELADEGTGSHRNIGDWLDHAWPSDFFNPLDLPNGPRTAQQWLTWRAKRPLAKQWLRAPAALSSMFSPTLQDEYRDWLSLERARFAADDGPLRTLWLRLNQHAWRSEWWEASTSLGVRPLAPFCTRELIELYFECHPLEWFDQRRPKAVLRRAMEGFMPDWHRQRPDKGAWPGFLQGAQLPASTPSNQLGSNLLSPAWLSTHFPPHAQTALLPALDALQLTWLTNMLDAVSELSRRCSPSRPLPSQKIQSSTDDRFQSEAAPHHG